MVHYPLLTLVLPCGISNIRWFITLSLPWFFPEEFQISDGSLPSPYPGSPLWDFKDQMAHYPLLTLVLPCRISNIRWFITLSLPLFSPVGFQISDGALLSPYPGSPLWNFKYQMVHYPLLTLVPPCGISNIRWFITLSLPWFSPVEFQISDGSLPSPYPGSPLWNFKYQMVHYPLLTLVLPCGFSNIRWFITLSLP